MADSGIGAKVDKKTVSYVVAGVFCVYALVYKIPIPCFGCQKEGFWFRCVMDTGEGTASCDAYKQAENRVKTAGRIMDQAGVYMDNLWDFARADLPGVIEDFITTLRDQILNLRHKMEEKFWQIIAFIQEKAALFASKIKEAVVSTYEKFLEAVINPVITFFVNNILEPVTKIFEKIVAFRDLVWKVLSDAIDKFANIGIGDVVGEVVDVFKSIPEAMAKIKPFVVKMINKLKQVTIGVVNTGLRESIKGIENSVNAVTGVVDDGVNATVGGLNGIKNTLVKTLNSSINGMSDDIERVVNGATGLIETSVNTTVGGVTSGINTAMNKVSSGVNRVIDTTNHAIGGAELALNTVSCGINKAMNKVEDGVNGIGKGVADGVNKVISPLGKVESFFNKVRNVRLKYDAGFVHIDIAPFEGFPSFDAPSKIDSPWNIDIDDIPVKEFGKIDADVDIKDIEFDGIQIDDINIPRVDIEAPKDIEEIDIPDLDIPEVEITEPDDLTEEDLEIEFPSIPGFGYISDQVERVKKSIKNIFEKAMEPLYEGVAVLVSLVASVISSSVTFFENYLTWTAVKKRVEVVLKFAGEGYTLLKDLFVEEILPAFVKLIETIKDPILDFVKKVTEEAWKVLKKIGVSVGKVFNEAFRVIAKVTGIIAKGFFHTGLYIIGTTVEKYTYWLPLPISVKMLLIIASVFWMFFGGFLSNGKVVIDVALLAVQGAAVTITDLDSMLDKGFGLKKVVGKPTTASSFLL